MAYRGSADSYLSLLTLREIRRYIVRSHAVMMSVFIGMVYGLLALTQSGMLVLVNLHGGYTVLPVSSPGSGPGYLVLAPWGVLSLPILGVIAMVLVAGGVALGMAVAVLLAVALVRRRGAPSGGPATIGSVAGLTPAMITLLAFGACCSTTAAASAGVGVIAQVSGSTTAALLVNNWFLSIFQVGIIAIALVAQEALLRVYGGLFGLPGAAPGATATAPRLSRRTAAGTALRAALLVAGVTWSLAMFAAWTTVAPGAASAATWVDWIVVHQGLAALAIGTALFPSAAADLFTGRLGASVARGLRGIALVGGGLLVVGAPPPLAGAGLEGLGNELLSWAGAPAAWGAVSPAYGPGAALAFRWGAQYLLLGGFAIVLALRPRRALRPVLWSVGPTDPTEEPVRSESGAPAIG
ncbi:MAG TPA: hypothetical protein VML94_02975 [Thermoplasmata archaeon]|nr:hypothetical protein [Thermoplasmata archaeon]